ncbi:HD-GYP domain-containing protein [Streptomyces sp. ICN441]|uniref:HD-GYP domain-containing protein n=1 Tax=Streptomyces sp. ICN441 TaxID=2558286 RepID=UPI00106C730D|nr:HD-GYP domain-containing protein [Streptomyces sp. ICN441]TFE49134.1 HD-GYP domain-containing protein [Streptomyces sp. ICN441]
MRRIPGPARAYILCAVVGAGACALPAVLPGADTPWTTVALLAGLHALSEVPGRSPILGRLLGGSTPVGSAPVGSGSFFPVLFAAALLLPPAGAALAAVPAALLGRVDRRPAGVRRVWRAARLALAAGAASAAAALCGGPAVLAGPALPYALVPAGAAALTCCLVVTALDGGILATAERIPVRTAWRGLLSGSLGPHLVHGLAGLTAAVLWRSPYGPPAALLVLLPVYISCRVFARYHREQGAHRSTIRALVQAVDIKDRYTRGHSERVGRASVLIARELGMDEERLEVLRFAGILHDVGKLGVPTRVLRKEGPLTPEERRVIELHPEYGHEIVRGIGFLGEARDAILHHHERLDGSGYPYGLAGRQIPEVARVVAVADAFDAMTSTRSYSRARPVPAAVEELKRCAGTQFDPRMVRALVRALERHGWEAAVTADEPAVPAQPSRGRGGTPARQEAAPAARHRQGG